MELKDYELAWLIRRHAVEMTHRSGASHLGAILSVADIIAYLYTHVLKYDSKNPKWDERDYFVLSKGHSGAALYAALAELGFFDKELLKSYYQNGSILSGHVSHKTVPGVDVSTGSLGHGISYAVGLAYALKKDNKPNRVFAVTGDGECEEGSLWEALNLAQQLKLDNLYVYVDYNKMQAMGNVKDIIDIEPLEDKFKAFNCEVISIDGHNFDEFKSSFESFKSNKPHVVICNTIKGKGVSFMQMSLLWHYRFPHDGEEYDNAVRELLTIKPESIKDPYEGGDK